MRFAGKVAVVTGAASGIGKASVLKLASEGAHVFAADIDEAGGQALAAASNGSSRPQQLRSGLWRTRSTGCWT